LHHFRTHALRLKSAVMRGLSLGDKNRRTLAEPSRCVSERSLRSSFARTGINNLILSLEKNGEKASFRAARE
jgi:hypothetical protein